MYRPRACCSPATKLKIENRHLNVVSGETQHKHRPPPFSQPGAASELPRGELAQPRNEGVNIWGEHRENRPLLSSPMGSMNPSGQGSNVPKAASSTAHTYLCSLPHVLTSSYLTGLVSSGLWATRNVAVHAARPRGAQVGPVPIASLSWQTVPCLQAFCSAASPMMSADGGDCGLKTPNSHCRCREKPAEPETTARQQRFLVWAGSQT